MEAGIHILAFGAHPDDVEMTCGGTIIKQVSSGNEVVIADLTQGELGTRGSAERRRSEAAEAAKIMGIKQRINLNFRDGFFRNDEEHQMKVIAVIRRYRPKIVLANAITDRHPDHARAAELLRDSCFLAGLAKIAIEEEGKSLPAWRPAAVYHYIQDRYIKPDFLVDVSRQWEARMNAVRAYSSQFYDSKSSEPDTYISQPGFLATLDGRAMLFGKIIGCRYAEGFTAERIPGVNDLNDLL
jgi:bacillithiol biosynthesis deacetylase BshB1